MSVMIILRPVTTSTTLTVGYMGTFTIMTSALIFNGNTLVDYIARRRMVTVYR